MADEIILSSLTAEQLRDELQAVEGAYQKTRFEHSVSGLANPNVLREMRKNIARIKTETRARELAEGGEALAATRTKMVARRRKK